MNERRVERERAARLAAALDELLADPASPPTGLEPEGEALLPTAQRLARLPALLGPASPGLLPEPEHLVRRVRAALPDGGPRTLLNSRVIQKRIKIKKICVYIGICNGRNSD